jgi:hypothetical protein
MNIFNEWGFEKTPFKTHPLPPDENGKILLINRKEEIKQLKTKRLLPLMPPEQSLLQKTLKQ